MSGGLSRSGRVSHLQRRRRGRSLTGWITVASLSPSFFTGEEDRVGAPCSAHDLTLL